MSNRHPKYGYDLDAVSSVLCIACSEPIGNEPYVEVTPLARFGQMLFIHSRCDESKKRLREQAPKEIID